MKKLHNRHYPAGLEWKILKILPKILLGGFFIPLFMSIIARLYPVAGAAADIAKHQTSIDILSISIFVAVLTALLIMAIGCITIVFMKGPGYVADAYELEDAERPEPDNENRK